MEYLEGGSSRFSVDSCLVIFGINSGGNTTSAMLRRFRFQWHYKYPIRNVRPAGESSLILTGIEGRTDNRD